MTQPVDAAPIGLFRLLFGLLMVVEVLRYWAHGRIARYYIEPTFFFSFVEGIRPVGGAMYLIFVLMGAAALLLAVGYYYRAASALFFVLYTYTFLLDKAQYNNHYYLICLPLSDDFLIAGRERAPLVAPCCSICSGRGWTLGALIAAKWDQSASGGVASESAPRRS